MNQDVLVTFTKFFIIRKICEKMQNFLNFVKLRTSKKGGAPGNFSSDIWNLLKKPGASQKCKKK